MPAWYETFFDGLYARVLPATFDPHRTLQQARRVRGLLRARKGQSVLDIPCGTGRLTLPLARTGLVMTGVDLCAAFLRRARAEARREGLAIRYLRSDMRRIDFHEAFDAAFNWFGSFGYFSDADNLAFCRLVRQALRPGGRFLVEGINKSWLLSHFLPTAEETIGGVRITHRNRYVERTGRIESLWTFRRGRQVERRRVHMRIYDGAELRALLREAGFVNIRLFDRRPAARFTRHSRRVIAVGERPAPT